MSNQTVISSCIIFDLETNGFSGSSVLSVSALYVEFLEDKTLSIRDEFNRFYRRNAGEPANPDAIRVNGLTDEKINLLRTDADYPEYFSEDLLSFQKFCHDCRFYVAHNISFDRQFVPFIAQSKNQFCTMKENTSINPHGKWPKLSDAAEFYGIRVDQQNLHGSRYDTELCYGILQAMYKQNHQNLNNMVHKS